jgi:hypothetical protein
LLYSKQTIVRGALVYSAGDLAAALILNEFSWTRLLGIVFTGATVYAFEIPNFFTWIEKLAGTMHHLLKPFARTLMAMFYFNPLWIARHLLFIKLFSGRFEEINSGLLVVASWSFLVNIPVSLAANYLIQNHVKMKWRFLASAFFSSLMAVYYAMSNAIFR